MCSHDGADKTIIVYANGHLAATAAQEAMATSAPDFKLSSNAAGNDWHGNADECFVLGEEAWV